MEQINLDTQQLVAVPSRRDERYVVYTKFALASDFSIPSYDPSVGDIGGTALYWVVLRTTDVNGYIGLGPGYITLNKPGIYQVSARATFRRDTIGNTQYMKYIELDIDSPAGAYSDGDTQRMTTNKNADGSFLLDETSLGAGDSGGSSAYAQCTLLVDNELAPPPRYVTVSVQQQSHLLQPQNLTPRNQDVWLQVLYLGNKDTLLTGGATGAVLQ